MPGRRHNLACLQSKWPGTERLGELDARATSPKRKITRSENVTFTQSV